LHESDDGVELAMIETFFNTFKNYSQVSVIARSTSDIHALMQRPTKATFKEGAGNCKMKYWNLAINYSSSLFGFHVKNMFLISHSNLLVMATSAKMNMVSNIRGQDILPL
jgi:predicted PolB exonuclease-like 3'-5' exonuclease